MPVAESFESLCGCSSAFKIDPDLQLGRATICLKIKI